MKYIRVLYLALFIAVLCTLTGRPMAVRAEGTDVPEGEARASIIAEAIVEPQRWSEPRFVVGGEVAAIQLAPGAQVVAGDLLVQLDPSKAALAVQEAEAALASAEAALALKRAGPRPEEIAGAKANVAAAEGELARAIASRNQFTAGNQEAQRAAVQAELEVAEAEAWQEEAEYRWAEDDGDAERLSQAEKELHAARLKVRAAQQRLEALPHFSTAQVQAANAWVSMAQARVYRAKAALALTKAGPTAEEIAMAEAAVRQADVALAEARVGLERTALYAPFDGTVTKVHVDVGDTVAQGQPVLVLAALDTLQARTTDLLELDVVSITEGQPVIVTVDALPDQVLRGHVRRIKLQSVVHRGDVTYPVFVELDEVPVEVLWGMTAMVEFQGDGEP